MCSVVPLQFHFNPGEDLVRPFPLPRYHTKVNDDGGQLGESAVLLWYTFLHRRMMFRERRRVTDDRYKGPVNF